MKLCRFLLATIAMLSTAPGVAQNTETAGIAHPNRWPAAHSVGLVDPATETRITALIATMSLREKVGQMIQADIGSIKLDDLRRYPVGDQSPAGPATLGFGGAKVDAASLFGSASGWRTVRIGLKCWRDRGADVTKVADQWSLTATGPFTVSIADLRLATDPSGAVRPEAAR